MTSPYEPLYKGYTITIVDTILAGRGYKAHFYINKAESPRNMTSIVPSLKEEGIVDEISPTAQHAAERALERAHAWIDAHIAAE